MPFRYPKEGEKYPGQKNGRCLGCNWPIDPNGDCGCGWNHYTKLSAYNDHCHIFYPSELKKLSKDEEKNSNEK